MAIINFEQMKANEPDRNFDNATIDENYNIGMQNGAGLYGAGKFFGLVQKAVNWLSTITGNKNFTGVVSMNDKKVATEEKAGELIATALTDYPTNSQTDTKINNALTNYQEKAFITISNGNSASFNWNNFFHILSSRTENNLFGEWVGDSSNPQKVNVVHTMNNVTIVSTPGEGLKNCTITNNSGFALRFLVNMA